MSAKALRRTWLPKRLSAHLVYAWVRNDDGQIVNWLCTCGTMGCDKVNRG